MALTRAEAQPLFDELITAGYKARIVGWPAPSGWIKEEGHAFSVSASVDDPISEAGVAATILAALVEIGARHGLKAYMRTFDVEGYDGERDHYGANVMFE